VFERAAADAILEDDEAEELVYGEFSLPLFCALLDEVSPSRATTFLDIGAGRGQLVLAAAKEWEWRECVGLEIVPELFHLACLAAESVGDVLLSPSRIVKGNMHHRTLGQVTAGVSNDEGHRCVAFLYATKFERMPDDECLLVSSPLHAALPSGSTAITVNGRLRESDGFELVSERTGPNPEGGEVKVYTWRSV